jgi:hypothetical protein
VIDDAAIDAVVDRLASRLARPLVVDIAGACQLLGCSWDFWAEHVAPEVRIVRRGRRKLVPVAELELWIDKNASAVLDGRRRAA